jgi:hypothetical protein
VTSYGTGWETVRTGPISLSSGACPSGLCVIVDANGTSGEAKQIAQGVLHGVTAATPSTLLAPLAMTGWRIQPLDTNRYWLARKAGGSVTMVLSDAWLRGNMVAGSPRPLRNPSNDWAAYAKFVRDTVQWHQARGMLPDYWDIQNEPESRSNYALDPAPTRELVLKQFRVAYAAIKEVQPDAKIVGPSLGNAVVNAPSQLVDMNSLLKDASVNGMRYDAISWHDGGYGPPRSFEGSARAIPEHVSWVRSTLALYPSLGQPPLFVNEYGAPFTQGIPAAEVGYLATLERAGIASAIHSCFPAKSGSTKIDTCFDSRGLLDGLVSPDLRATSAWWVHNFYASMKGTRIFADGNIPQIPAFATRSTNGEIDVLVGHDRGCNPQIDATYCPRNTPVDKPLTPMLALTAPSGGPSAYAVTIDLIRHQTSPLDAPVSLSVPSPVSVVDGRLVMLLPALAQGDALFLRLIPAAN